MKNVARDGNCIFGEGDSAVSAAWEYGDFDGKQDTDNACRDFCFNNV